MPSQALRTHKNMFFPKLIHIHIHFKQRSLSFKALLKNKLNFLVHDNDIWASEWPWNWLIHRGSYTISITPYYRDLSQRISFVKKGLKDGRKLQHLVRTTTSLQWCMNVFMMMNKDKLEAVWSSDIITYVFIKTWVSC